MKTTLKFLINNKKDQNRKHYTKKVVFKDYYKSVYQIIKKNKYQTVLDIGCANGALSFFADKKTKIVGLDLDKKLLNVANSLNKQENKIFKNLNIFNKSSVAKKFIKDNNKKFDLITIFGTLHLFPDYKNTIKILTSLKPKMIIITTMLNEFADVRIIYRRNSQKSWENTYNYFSKKGVKSEFSKKGYSVQIMNYKTKTFLKKISNSIRNYNFKLKNNKKILVNELGLFLKEYLIISKLKKTSKK